jgi:hypothetical protein
MQPFTRHRRKMLTRLLLGFALFALNANLLLAASLRGAPCSPIPRRARRLMSQAPTRSTSRLDARGKRTPRPHVSHEQTSSDHGVAAVQAAALIRSGEIGFAACDADFALDITFPPRYLVFCSFLC